MQANHLETVFDRLPLREVALRAPILQVLFGRPSRGALVMLINADRTYIEIPGITSKPSIAHSMTTCDVCGTDAWIGPNQKKIDGLAICLICLAIVQHFAVDGSVRSVHVLDPDHDLIPRRI